MLLCASLVIAHIGLAGGKKVSADKKAFSAAAEGETARKHVARSLEELTAKLSRQMLIDDEHVSAMGKVRGSGGPTNLESAMITWVAVDSMHNIFGPASRSVKPMAYDAATNALAIIHRGDALSYAQTSGELFYNLSTDGGATWSRITSLNGPTGDLLARYPGCAIWNPTNSPDPNSVNILFVFAAPQLMPGGGAFGRVVYGANTPLTLPGEVAFIAPDTGLWSNQPVWAGGGTVFSTSDFGVYWASRKSATPGPVEWKLWRTADYDVVPSGVPSTWANANFLAPGLDVAGWWRGGKSYFSVFAVFPGEVGEVWNLGYSTSTDKGATWSTWTTVGPPPAGKDWRNVPGIKGSIYDDWFDYGGPGIHSFDMVVDANGRVHFFGVLHDLDMGGIAVVEIYESASGWASKIIASGLKQSTDLTYPTCVGSLNQMGHHLNASISADGTVMALFWLDAPVEGNTYPDIWMSYRHISGGWSAPVNLTATPTFAEIMLHAAPTLKSNGGGSYTAFLGRSYEAGITSWPPEGCNRSIFYAGSTTFTGAVQLTKNIQVHSVTVTPESVSLGAPVTVSAVIENYGSEADPASVTLTYKDGSVPANTGDGTTQTFAPTWVNHSATVTFSVPYTTAIPGTVNMYVRAFYPGDEDPSNDVQFTPHKATAQNDIAAKSLDDPVHFGAKAENVPFSPKATFRNEGVADQTSPFNVRYEILNAVPSIVYSNTQSIPSLASGASVQVTFDPVSGGLAVGTYSIRAISLLGTDQLPSNDTISGTLYVLPLISSFPYTENFEDPTDGSMTGGYGWYTGYVERVLQQPSGTPPPPRTSVIDWIRGTPAKVQISGAHSGTKCYVTKLTGNYSDQTETFLGSPVFNFSSVTGPVIFEFWQNMKVEPNWDGGVVEISTDGGYTWARLDSALGTPPGYVTQKSANWYSWNDTLGYLDYIKFTHNADSANAADPNHRIPVYPGNLTGWFKSATVLNNVAGLSDVRFRFHFSSDDAVNNEGWAIDDVTIRVAASSVNTSINTGWNLISNPVQRAPGTDSVRHLYPNSTFPYVFAFVPGTGYSQRFTMSNGLGYWGKFPSAHINTITGAELLGVNVAVSAGWNLLGSISMTIDTGAVQSNPEGLRASSWFGYLAGYVTTAQIQPGKGYWVKSSGNGSFGLVPGAPSPGPGAQTSAAIPAQLSELSTLTITDAAGNSSTLYFGSEATGIAVEDYELPPVPPAGSFDVRFETRAGGFMVQTHGSRTAEMIVAIQSDAYPLTVAWNVKNSGASYLLSDAMGGQVVPAQTLSGSGSLTIKDDEVVRLVLKSSGGAELLPKEFALWQNYPNPFNPTTAIRYALPVDSKVTIEIYNVLGQRVNTLVNEERRAGYHVVEWDATSTGGASVGSGVYFLRLHAKGANGKDFTDVKKLLLLK